MATLVYSTKWFPKSRTLSVWEPASDSCERLMRDIFANFCLNKRLKIDRNRYFYQPSDDYKQYVVKIRNTRK